MLKISKNKLLLITNDLRLRDNYALHNLCKNNITSNVIALLILPIEFIELKNFSHQQTKFFHKSLFNFELSIKEYGIPLHYICILNIKDLLQKLISFCKTYYVDEIFCNLCYRYFKYKNFIINSLSKYKIETRIFKNETLFELGFIKSNINTVYKVFTPFFNKALRLIKCINIIHKPKKQPDVLKKYFCNLIKYSFKLKLNNLSKFSEKNVILKLIYFCKFRVNRSYLKKDLAMSVNSSMLSMHMRFGIISHRQCIYYLLRHNSDFLKKKTKRSGVLIWMKEVIWREFYQNITYYYSVEQHYNKKYNLTNEKIYNLYLWKSGKTGIPIVDAAMRQLNKTGWINNRLRMITSSFLVKNLLIDWRAGARYFFYKLIDSDTASNLCNWMWIDSMQNKNKRLKIFNPIKQSKRYDKFGKFIKTWMPELRSLKINKIHYPYKEM